jgi:DNA-binding CsgD family transcriptional regulator
MIAFQATPTLTPPGGAGSRRSAVRTAVGAEVHDHLRPMGDPELEARGVGLVGRGLECALIDRLLHGASRGESGSLVLRGEVGVGKTALLGYAADRAADMTVLSAAGVEVESELAFAGLHSLVRPIVDKLPELPAPQRAALAAALGLGPAEGSDRFLVSAAVLSLLAAGAEDGPILCLVDDVQWLDAPSADSLVFTARRLGAEGIVILFAAREGEVRRFDGPGLDELTIGELDEESAGVLLDRAAGEAPPSVRDRLLAEAAGNPLALLELPAGLSSLQLAGRGELPDAIPLSSRLQAAFRQRIEALPKSTQAALLIAAAEDGGELAVILRAAGKLELPQDALDPAEEAGLIQTDDLRLTFRHPVVRSAAYGSTTLSQRRRVHGALAGAFPRGERAEAALWHRAMATLTADEEVAAELEASARRAERRGGHASAATAFDRAAQLSDNASSRGRRFAAAAEAAWEAGQVDRARDLVDRALTLVDRPQRARLLYLRGIIEGRSGRLEEALTTFSEGVDETEDVSLALEMLREASDSAMFAGAVDQMIALGERAGEFTPDTDIDRFIVASLTGLAAELSGDYARGAGLFTEAVELAERLDDPQCLILAALTAGREGIWGDGLAHANRAVRVARERALVTTLPNALRAQASQLLGRSQFDLAYSAAEEGRRLALDLGQPGAASWNLADLATIDALRGAEPQALAHVEELEALLATSGPSLASGQIGRTLGLLHLGLGRPSEALDQLLMPLAATRLESSPTLVLGLPDAVEAASRSQRLDEVGGLLERFRAWVERFPNPARLAILARCRALADEPDAEQHYARAIELSGALAPFDRARTELLYGEWLRRERRRIDARPHLRTALELFERLAVPPWAERARSELRASGETARKRDPSTRDQLTPRELQIAGLAAEGMTNPQIGAQLFLSARTIDYHLRKVFTKLEIASRRDLARLDLGNL